jgi:hypothetical protein
MIKYSKEEFPARFSVFEHVCKYCGVTFYSNRKRTQYDTGTCRAKAWKERKTSTSTSTTKTKNIRLIKSLPLDYDEPSTFKEAESLMNLYFFGEQRMSLKELIRQGIRSGKSENEKYSFQIEKRKFMNPMFNTITLRIFKEE